MSAQATPRKEGFVMVEMSDIHAMAESIVREFNPERIILFGSYARGTPGPDSDVDLLVVLPFEGKTWRMASEIRGRIRPHFPLDLLVRTPEAVRQRIEMGDTFLRDVLRHGKVLYEAHDG